MRPQPAARIAGTTARVTWNVPPRCTPRTSDQWTSDIFQSIASRVMPALLTATSMRPDQARASSTAAATDSGSATSTATGATRSVRDPHAASRASGSRSTDTIRAPDRANNVAIAWPMPRAAPVTSTVRPVKSYRTGMTMTPHVEQDWDEGLSVQVPDLNVGDTDRLVDPLRLRGEPCRDLQAAGHLHHGGDGRVGPDATTRGQRRRETDAVKAVVDHRRCALDLEQVTEPCTRAGQREIAVRDRPAVFSRGGTLRVDVDPLVVVGRIGEAVDAELVDLQPVADPEVTAGRC